MNFMLQWIDVIWLVLAGLIPHKNQRAISIAFVAACMIMMRLQVELMGSIGFPAGILSLMDLPVFFRGLGVYSVFYAGFLLLAYYSPGTKKVIVMAAASSLFFAAMFISSLFMVL